MFKLFFTPLNYKDCSNSQRCREILKDNGYSKKYVVNLV